MVTFFTKGEHSQDISGHKLTIFIVSDVNVMDWSNKWTATGRGCLDPSPLCSQKGPSRSGGHRHWLSSFEHYFNSSLIRKGNVAYQSIRNVSLNTYMVFHRSTITIKLLPKKNCWWPFMTWNDLRDIRGQWSQYSDSGCQVYLQPDVWVFRMVFVQ